MKTKSITYTKNHLSAVVREVQAGASYLVCDHGEPVAVLAPVGSMRSRVRGGFVELEKSGIVRRGQCRIGAEFFSAKLPEARDGSSVVEALLHERRESR